MPRAAPALHWGLMLPIIEKLLILQDRDKALAQADQALAHAPKERKLFEERKTAAARALEAARSAVRDNEIERKNLELESARHAEQVAKFKAQQNLTRKNEEFAALANEIRHFQEKITALDDRQLELMEAAQGLAAAAEAAAAEHRAVEAEVAKLIADLETRTASLAARKAELEAERARLAAEIDEDILDTYERIFKKKGDAVVPLEHGVCGGCHMKASNATLTDAMTEKEIVFCDKCGRILYFTE